MSSVQVVPVDNVDTTSLHNDSIGKGDITISSTEHISDPKDESAPGHNSTRPSNTTESNNQTSSSATQNETVQNESKEALALKVLQLIETYGVNYERSNASWDGLTGFLPLVTKQIKNNDPIYLLLPGFPFKSPNSTDKVLGLLPDLGEELALSHLDGLCKNIGQIYEHGAEVHICSDGLVYNDLLGVSNEAVWDYGEEVRRIADKRGLTHLKFIRLWDLLDHPGPWSKEFYLTHAECIRREMIYRFRDVDFEADMANKSSDDVRMTHSGYLKAVAKDLAHSPLLQDLGHEEKELKIQSIAKSMMGRWKAYASALETIQDHYVRLSIHDSKGGGKLSMALVPQDRGVIGYTPWHSTVAVELDGSYRIVHASEVRDTHELVYVNGRPYYYRAKSDLFDWKADGLDVTFEPQYPTGLFIRPANVSEAGAGPSLCNVPMQKVRQLSHTFSPVVLRGFRETTDEEIFVSKAYEIGQIMEWPSFGKVLKVKDIGSTRKEDNNVTSSEAMPMHFDGVFKFADVTDPATGEVKKVMTPPNYQYFTCISTAAKNTGVTLYANSRLFFRHVPAPWTMERLEKVTWSLESDGYWSSKLEGIPLVERHKETGAPCVRFHEHWPNNTKFSKFYHKIENDDQSLIDVATKVLYDYRVCLRFEWEQGDILVSDNVAMLHTRTAFGAGCDRELWRIHIK